jgi:hypothetical protein
MRQAEMMPLWRPSDPKRLWSEITIEERARTLAFLQKAADDGVRSPEYLARYVERMENPRCGAARLWDRWQAEEIWTACMINPAPGEAFCARHGGRHVEPPDLAQAAWVKCVDCDEWWCRIHQAHASECACPAIEDWQTDPYDDPVHLATARSEMRRYGRVLPDLERARLRRQEQRTQHASKGKLIKEVEFLRESLRRAAVQIVDLERDLAGTQDAVSSLTQGQTLAAAVRSLQDEVAALKAKTCDKCLHSMMASRGRPLVCEAWDTPWHEPAQCDVIKTCGAWAAKEQA